MHFVKKDPQQQQVDDATKTSLDKKRQAKLLAFTQARDRVFEKRGKGEFDEELMETTAELLGKNPDIYTLWNVRREAVEHFVKVQQDEDVQQADKQVEDVQQAAEEATKNAKADKEATKNAKVDKPADATALLAKLVDHELELAQKCLMRNPKSYSSWHHLYLMVCRHPQPNLRYQLDMCERALMLDCRNFHCWDHRRAIAKLAGLDEAEELSFSDRLIGKNPSNYSAWHYRGTLLPRLHPNVAHPEQAISDECLAQEFEKVLHVCGVNSEDQTAWTYCRWLVEVATARDESTRLISAQFVCPDMVQFVFSSAVDRQAVQAMLDHNGTFPAGSFTPKGFPTCSRRPLLFANVWLLSPAPGTLKFLPAGSKDGTKRVEIDAENNGRYVDREWLERHFTSAPTCTRDSPRKCLEQLVALCEELIPVEDNPWELAALTRARLALDGVNEGTMALAEANLHKLEQIDPQRARMYAELMDRLRLVNALQKPGEEGTSQLDQLIEGKGRLTLKDIGLNSLFHLRPLSGLVTHLELKDNPLSDPHQIAQLASTFTGLEHLALDGCPLEGLPPLNLPRLKFLSLARTHVRAAACIKPALGSLPSLERVLLAETELASSREEQMALREMFGEGRKVRLIFHWM